MIDWAEVRIRFRWILTCLVFFVFPFLLVSFGLGKRWTSREIDSINRYYEGLDGVLLALRTREETHEYLRFLVERLSTRASQMRAPGKDFRPFLEKSFKSLRARFPGVFRFYIVDGNGDLIPSLTEPGTSKHILKKLFFLVKDCMEHEKGEDEIAPFMSMLRTFIGPQVTAYHIAKGKRFINASIKEKGRWFYYQNFPQLGFYTHFDFTPDFPMLAIRDNGRRLRRWARRTDVMAGSYSFGDPLSSGSDLQEAMSFFKKANRAHFMAGEKAFSVMSFSPTTVLWAAKPTRTISNLFWNRMGFLIPGMVLMATLFVLSHRVMVQGKRMVFPIRLRLVVLFGFAGGLPLAAIILTGWDYAGQTFKNRIRESYDEAERILKTFDAKFPRSLSTLEKQFSRLFNACNFETRAGARMTIPTLRMLEKRFPTALIRLFDRKGKLIWGKRDTSTMGKLLENLVSKILAEYNQEEPNGKLDTASLLIDTLGGGDPFAEITKNLGTIKNVALGGNENWLFASPLRNRNGKGTHLVFIIWKKADLEKVYLETCLPATQKTLDNLTIYATNPMSDTHFPAHFADNSGLKRFVKSVQLRQGTTFGRFLLQGKNVLLTGIKPKELASQYLVAMQCDESIKFETNLLERRLWIFSFISAAISLFLGFILSRRFLTPIGFLTKAVEAIRRRDFQHRLPPGEPDELGELASTFNRVMEGLTDLEVGRIVQESLLPSGTFTAGEYKVFGRTVTATELGGDYFEIETLPDGKLLILIGDVTGHGVPAALVMAMAKALVSDRTFEGTYTPEMILTSMHRVIFKTLKRKKMMTCFLAMLDPETHQFSYANAGHNYPYLFRKGQPPQFLESDAAPLGGKKKMVFEPKLLELQKGDIILFYTDGIVEQVLEGTTQIGYNKFSSEVQGLLSADPVKSTEEVFAWYKRTLQNAVQDDDVTVVLLCHQETKVDVTAQQADYTSSPPHTDSSCGH